MPESVKKYPNAELELNGLAINSAGFAFLLKKFDFDAAVDHFFLTYIIKIKSEPATNSIKRLLEVFSSYLFNPYYIEGKDMILHDFLSRENLMILIHMNSFLYSLSCKKS